MGAYPSVLVPHLQAHLKRKQQKEEFFFSPVQVLAMNLVTIMSVTGWPYGSYCRDQRRTQNSDLLGTLSLSLERIREYLIGLAYWFEYTSTVLNAAASKFWLSDGLQILNLFSGLGNLRILPKNVVQHFLYVFFQYYVWTDSEEMQ